MASESHSYMLDAMVDRAFFKNLNKTGSCFLASCIADYKHMYPRPCFTTVMNTPIYNWYFGTFANKVLCIVFQPGLFSKSTYYEEDYKHCLDEKQVAEILHTTFTLVAFHGLDLTTRDYYGTRPYSSLLHSIGHLGDKMPPHIRSAANTFLYLFKHGSALVNLQQNHIRAWCRAKRNQRVRAVRRIEDWWFEIINDPDTRPGRRMLAKRAQRWHSLKN